MAESIVSIPKNSLVTVFLKGNISVEGIVVSWQDSYAILRVPNGMNNIVIYSPSENVLMVKLIRQESSVTASDIAEEEEEPEEEALLPQNLEQRVEKQVKARVKAIGKEKRKIAKRLKTAPKNVAPQQSRYEMPWDSK